MTQDYNDHDPDDLKVMTLNDEIEVSLVTQELAQADSDNTDGHVIQISSYE